MSEPIRQALRYRHAKDVLIEECNLGSAHAGCRRMDAWVLLKTWSPWTTIGYEVKADRQDFLRDRKWVEYLPLCHEFYFVCPVRLIQPEELPAEVGLLWTTNGARLQTKRKAVRREPDAGRLSMLMSYALMSRARIVADMWEANRSEENRAAYWREWLEEDQEKQRLGREVSERIRQIVNRAETRARRAEYERDRLEGVREQLKRLGLDEQINAYQIEQRTTNAPTLREIRRLADRIAELSGPLPVEATS